MQDANLQGLNQEKIIQLVIFYISNEEFGVPIEEIQEIIKYVNITPIPDVPDFIKGIINVRGDIVTVIDLKSRFSIQKKSSAAKHIIITKQYDNFFGLIVDEVTEVLRISESEIKFPTALNSKKIRREYLNGVVVVEERLIVLLDLSQILSEEEFSRLAELSSSYKEGSARNSEEEGEIFVKNKKTNDIILKKGNLGNKKSKKSKIVKINKTQNQEIEDNESE